MEKEPKQAGCSFKNGMGSDKVYEENGHDKKNWIIKYAKDLTLREQYFLIS